MRLRRFLILTAFLTLPLASANAALRVISALPSGQIDDGGAANMITVSFSEQMVPLAQLPEGDGTGPIRLNPSVPGKFRWQGTSTLAFIPAEPLPDGTRFTVTVPEGLKSAVTGSTLENDFTWTFQTARPRLITSYPDQGQGWIMPDDRIYLMFNQPMDPRKVKPLFPGKGTAFITLNETGNKTLGETVNFTVRTMVKADEKDIRSLLNRDDMWQVYELQRATHTHVLVVTPEKPLNRDKSYALTIEKGTPGAQGTLGTASRSGITFSVLRTFRFIRPAEWDALEPSSPVPFHFTNPIKISDILSRVSFDPPVVLPDDERAYSYFSFADPKEKVSKAMLNVSLKAGTTYQVAIKAGLKDKYGGILENPSAFTLKTRDYDPRIIMPEGMGIVERYLEPLRHPVTLLNVDRLHLQKTVIKPEEIVPFASRFQTGDFSAPLVSSGGFTVDRLWETRVQRNERTTLPLDLKEALGQSKGAIVYMQVDALNLLRSEKRYFRTLLQVTSMGITGKFSPEGSLVYVSHLKTANPVKKCSVELRNDSNKVIWKGATNSEGFVKTPGWEELGIVPASRYDMPKIWVIARKDDDCAFIHSDWGTGIYPYNFNIPYEWRPEYPRYGSHIFTERGIYRPGDTVHIKGIVRERRAGSWQKPRLKEYDFFIKDSHSNEIFLSSVTLSDLGSFDISYAIDPSAPTGYYTAYVWEKGARGKKPPQSAGEGDESYYYDSFADRKIRFSASFRVEEYKPATFEISVKHNEPSFIAGDTVTVTMNGRYLFGAPMPEAPVTATSRLDRSVFQPESFPGYSFASYSDDSRYYSSPGVLVSRTEKLDKEGNFTYSFSLPARHPGTFSLVSEGNVEAPDRQRLSGRKSSIVHGGEYYIGLKAGSSFTEKGKPVAASIITITPDEKISGGHSLQGQLVRREWNSVKHAGTGGRWEWRTERVDTPVSSFTVTSASEPVEWQFTPDKAGLYYLTVQGTDARGSVMESSVHFYVTGTDYLAWGRDNEDRIELVADKTRYRPGETASVLVKSPYESARALVTIEREGIIKQWTTTVRGSVATIPVPLTAGYAPNVYVCVMLYQGRIGDIKNIKDGNDTGKPSFKIGYTNLPVDPGERRLSVNVASDKKEYRPGQTVKVKLKVTNARGKGVPAEVTFAAVDTGVLNLIDFATPDTFPFFYGSRPLSVETAETRLHIIGQRNYGEKGENRGGGGGMMLEGIDLRSKFVPTACWKPSVRTASNGTAEVSFILPDNLSTYRIMASAATADSLFGAGDTSIRVDKPLLLKPSLPRFVTVGDTFTAGVLCHNNTSAAGQVTLSAAVQGARVSSDTLKTVFIEKGGAKEVTFTFTADAPGKISFTFKAALDQETDGLSWEIPVKVPRPTETVATFGSTTGTAREGLVVPSGIYDASSSLSITLSPTALAGLKGGLEYLFNYPYGCLEQRTSKVLPLLLAGNFIDQFDLAPLKDHSAKEIVTGYLALLPSYQTDSGGFSIWSGGDSTPSPYLTAYVLWVMAEANKQGYTLNPAVTKRAVEYLRAYLRGNNTGWSWPYSVNEDLCSRAFCVYSLSEHGVNEQPNISNLYEKRSQIPLFGKVYLLKALKKAGMRQDMITTLSGELANIVMISPTEAHFEDPGVAEMWWIWDSNVRTTAAILQGLLEVNGEFPYAERVARWLAGRRVAGRWNSTQENAYVLYAFREYVNRYENETPDLTAAVSLAEKEIIRDVFKGRTTKSKTSSFPVEGIKRDEQLPMVFSKQGTGRLYYDLRMTYAPVGESPTRDEGMQITKTIEPFKDSRIEGNAFALAGRYKVTIKVKTGQERRFVAVDDPLPGGFEIVNLSLATESREELKEFTRASGSPFQWWGTFDRVENRDDRVLLFANSLTPGEHTYSYLVQATTAGDFTMPPSKAEEMYTPEIFGTTATKRITIN